MLLNDFFYITQEDIADSRAVFGIRLNAEHEIFSGHFKGHPIVPGVCIIQMGINLFSYLQKRDYHLTKAKNIKFLHIIEPQKTLNFDYQLEWEGIDDNSFRIKIIVENKETIFAKIDLELSHRTNGEGGM